MTEPTKERVENTMETAIYRRDRAREALATAGDAGKRVARLVEAIENALPVIPGDEGGLLAQALAEWKRGTDGEDKTRIADALRVGYESVRNAGRREGMAECEAVLDHLIEAVSSCDWNRFIDLEPVIRTWLRGAQLRIRELVGRK